MGCLFGLIRVELASDRKCLANFWMPFNDGLHPRHQRSPLDNNIGVPSLTGYHMWIYTSDDRGP